MQKKITVLAIAAVLTSPAAALADTANVTLYGVASVSYDIVNTGDAKPGTAGNKGATSMRVSSNSSRIGLKGAEDLGGGLSAIWQVESYIALDAGNNGLGTRNTFAGVKSDSIGSLTMGNNDTPYKISSRRLDMFADGIADNRTLMGRGALAGTTSGGGINFDNRVNNLVTYTSPVFVGGLSVAGAYANRAETSTLATATDASTTSLAVMYDAAPFYGAFAYETHSTSPNAAASTKENGVKLSGGFAEQMFSVNVVLEKTSDDLGNAAAFSAATNPCGGQTAGANCGGHTAVYVAGKFNIGSSGAVKAAVTKMGKNGSAANSGATQVAAGYDHSMTKRTTLYALFTMLKNETAAGNQLGLSNTGIATSAVNMNTPGNTATALSIGLRHTF